MRSDAARPLVFVINSLEGGGAERVFATVVNRLVDAAGQFEKADVHVVLLDTLEQKYPLSDKVVLHTLDCGGSTLNSVRRLRALLKTIHPECVISFLTRANVANIAARSSVGHCAVISERVNTSSHFASGLSGRIGRAMVRFTYPSADAVIAVSGGVRDDLVSNYRVKSERTTVIPNPYEIEKIRAAGAREPEMALPDNYVVAVGRLAPNKNFAMLIEAFARSKIDGSLVILGEGEERAALMARAASLGVEDRVLLPGFVSNPHAIVSRARFYASSSNAEGFPNAMAEAMVLGRAIVGTDCPSGPSELLGGSADQRGAFAIGEHGLLVCTDDAAGMAAGMRHLADTENASAFGKKGAARVADFHVDRITDRYKEFIRALRDSIGSN